MPWTKQQQQAIDLDGNGIVSAAAGAGKTAVLTERVVRLCRSGMPLENMLVLTFTRAAAAEMKSRIASALRRAAREELVQKRRTFLFDQADYVANANISTIHSFCRHIIARHFNLADLQGNDRTLDESESAILKKNAMDRAILDLATNNSPSYRTLVGAFDGEPQAIAAALKLFEFLTVQPEPSKWLSFAREGLIDTGSFEQDEVRLTELMQQQLSFALEDYQAARKLIPSAYDKALAQIDAELTTVRAALIQPGLATYTDSMRVVQFDTLRFPRGTDDQLKAPLQAARNSLKDIIKAQLALLNTDTEALHQAQVKSGCIFGTLCELVDAFTQQYEALKRERCAIDYSDLEHKALKILQDERVRSEYRSQIKAIIVDEYQDSNRVQEAILHSLSTGDNIFLVGDVKQSIYGFRLAEPKLFLSKCLEYPKIELSHNFRSCQQVIDLVNTVFEKLMQRPISPMDYDDAARLIRGREQPQGHCSFHIIERSTDADDDEESLDDTQCQARLVAEEIVKRMHTGAYSFSDFAILLRSTKNADVWAKTLRLYGISCYAQSSGGYFDSLEVMIVLNLLRIIDNRRQDIPLLSVLRSPFGGFTDEKLARLRIACPKGEVLDCLLMAAESGDEQCQAFLNWLNECYELSRTCGIEALLGHILSTTSFYDEMGAVNGGAQRQANLDALVDRAAAFDKISSGIHSFLVYMDGDLQNARSLAAQMEQANVVSIITIHKSKGLEFPVVFLGNLERRFTIKDSTDALLLHQSLGAALRYAEPENRLRRDSLRHRILRKIARRDAMQEEMRVLYVALTRAQRELILVGSLKNAADKLSKPVKATMGTLSGAKSYLDWLMLTLNGTMSIEVHQKSEYAASTTNLKREDAPIDQNVLEALRLRLSWEYPHSTHTALPQKTSVSALSQQHELEFLPLQLGQRVFSAASRGTATHLLIKRIGTRGAALSELVAMTNADASLMGAYTQDVHWFLQSDIYKRMQSSPRAHSELTFCHLVDSNTLYGIDSHELILLQGIIDACFVENGAWVLLDFKTDRITHDDFALQALKHKPQLDAYAAALEGITHLPVKEKHVVLLRAHRTEQV